MPIQSIHKTKNLCFKNDVEQQNANKIQATYQFTFHQFEVPPCFQRLVELRCKTEKEEPPSPWHARLNNPNGSSCEPATKLLHFQCIELCTKKKILNFKQIFPFFCATDGQKGKGWPPRWRNPPQRLCTPNSWLRIWSAPQTRDPCRSLRTLDDHGYWDGDDSLQIFWLPWIRCLMMTMVMAMDNG